MIAGLYCPGVFGCMVSSHFGKMRIPQGKSQFWTGILLTVAFLTGSIGLCIIPAHAQTVLITFGPPNTSAGSGSASFSASADVTGSPKVNSEETLNGDPTYQWSAGSGTIVDTCSPATGQPSTSVDATRSAAGNYSSTVNCVVTWSVIDTKTNKTTTISQPGSATANFSLGNNWTPDNVTAKMTKPQDQTQTPPTPQYVVVQAGGSTECAAACAAVDDWNFGTSQGTATNTNCSYSWTASAGTFNSSTSATPNWTAPATSQSGPVTISCTVTAIPPTIVPPDGGTRESGSATCSVQVYVPGPMTILGPTDMDYYLDGTAPSVTFSTASNGSVTGMAYSWSVTGPLSIVGSSTGATVVIATTNPNGAASGTVSLSYTPSGGSATSATPLLVNVHMPSTVQIDGTETPPATVYNPTTQNPGQGYGFDDEEVQWQLLDQQSRPMPGETVSESWPVASQVLDPSIGSGAGKTTVAASSFPLTNTDQWSTNGSGDFDSPDQFGTSGWGFNASKVLIWTQAHALFTAVHQFIDHGMFTSHATSWSSNGTTY